jgi:PAS domain S-box-containing protein
MQGTDIAKGAQGMRERILFFMILIGTALSVITFIPGAFLTVRNGLWPVLLMNSTVLICGVLLLVMKDLTYRIKAWVACFLIYAVGAYVVIFFGFLSGGPIWLFTFGVMCGLLLGTRAAILGIAVNGATLLALSWLHATTSLGENLPFFLSGLHWLTTFGGFVVANAFAAVFCSLVLKDEEEVSIALKTERSQILEANERLAEEISTRKEAEKKQRELARELEFLNAAAIELVTISDEETLYRVIGRRIKSILGDVVVIVNSFEPKRREFRAMAVEGLGATTERFMNILGRNPIGMVTTLNDDFAEETLKTGKLADGPKGIYELSFYVIPKPIAVSLDKLLGMGRIYVIGLVLEGDLFGSIAIVDRNPSTDAVVSKNRALVEAYVNQAALAILRNRSERELKESEERYRQLVDNTPAGIYELDLENFVITNINKVMCEYTGYTKEEFLALNPLGLLSEESLELYIERGRAAFAGHPIAESTEYKLLRKDGAGFWARFKSKVDYVEGAPVKATFVVHDITEMKALEQERQQLRESLLEARKMEAIATLAGGVAHQFNNALSVVSVSMDMLDLCREDGIEQQKYMDMVRESIQKMTGLTGQLLAYARGGKYYARIISLSRFISETLPAVLAEMSDAIEVETDLSPDVRDVEADPKQMKSVLSAILTNAAEAMEEGGTVRITCANQMIGDDDLKTYPDLGLGPYVALIIEDTGRGMDRETRMKIFDPFFTTKFQGRGLAMPAVLGIVRNHGGWIGVDSEVGKGTMVHILLPAVPERREP